MKTSNNPLNGTAYRRSLVETFDVIRLFNGILRKDSPTARLLFDEFVLCHKSTIDTHFVPHRRARREVYEMVMSYWIQKADFSTDEFDPVDVSTAVSAANSHDWSAEIDRLESLSAQGAEYCDPGIGFVPGDGRILHICPNRETFYVHYHYSREARFLGLFKTSKQVTRSAFDLPITRMGDFVRRFFDSDHDWFTENTTSA